MSAHRKSLHEGVSSTLAEVRSLFWIPVLRKLNKFVIKTCYPCKHIKAIHHRNAKPGFLLRDRSEKALPSEIVGTNLAGPLYYKSKGK